MNFVTIVESTEPNLTHVTRSSPSFPERSQLPILRRRISGYLKSSMIDHSTINTIPNGLNLIIQTIVGAVGQRPY